jgi:hypothetical protein
MDHCRTRRDQMGPGRGLVLPSGVHTWNEENSGHPFQYPTHRTGLKMISPGQEREALEAAASEAIDAHDAWAVMNYPSDGASRHHAEAWFAESARVEQAIAARPATSDWTNNEEARDEVG